MNQKHQKTRTRTILSAWFFSTVVLYSFLRDAKKVIIEPVWRSQFVKISDKTNFAGLVTGAFSIAGTALLLAFYYGFLCRRMEEKYAFHTLTFLSLSSFSLWQYLYFFNPSATASATPLIRKFLGDSWIYNINPSVSDFFDNLHAAFFIALCEVIPPIYISLFWSYVNKVADHLEKNAREDISAFGAYAQAVVTLPVRALLLSGITDNIVIVRTSYYSVYACLLSFSAFRYYLDNMYPSSSDDEQKSTDNTLVRSFTMLVSNDVIWNVFLSTSVYFTMNTFADTVFSSLVSDIAISQTRNTSQIFSKMSKVTLQEDVKYFINSAVSVMTAILTTVVKHYRDYLQLDKVEEMNETSVIVFSATTTVMCFVATIYYFVYAASADWTLLFLGFIALSVSRTVKYIVLDPVRYSLFSTFKDKEERELGKAAVDIYSSKFVKGIMSSVVNNSMESLYMSIYGGPYFAYYNSLFYLFFTLPLALTWWQSAKKVNEYTREQRNI